MKLIEILKKKTKRFLSIDFGQAFVKIAYLQSLGDNFIILNYDLKEIRSKEEKRDEIVNFINNFLKTNSISEKETFLTLSDLESIIIKQLVLPAVPKEEIQEVIKWQLKGEVPFNIENAVLDWQIVKEYSDEDGTKKNIITCILAASEIINKNLSILGDCGLTPLRISSSPFNYAYILSHLQENPSVIAVLDMGYKDTTLCIYNSKLNFIRNLAFSSHKLTQSLTATLISDRGKVELSYEKAEDIKKTFGIPAEKVGILKDNIQASQVISLMRPFLEELTRELKRSLEYFSSSPKEKSPSVFYITGGGANLKNLERYLGKELNINISKLPLPGCINTQKIDKEKLEKDQSQMMSAIGASLADSGGINLLPQELKTQKIEFIETVSLRVVTIILSAILLFSLFIFKFQERDYKKRLKTAQIHLQTIEGIRVLKQKIYLMQLAIDRIQKHRIPVDGLLKQISNIVPGNILLNELNLDTEGHVLILKGAVSASESVAQPVLTDFMKKIETSAFFSDVALVISKNIGGVQEFEIKCDLAH